MTDWRDALNFGGRVVLVTGGTRGIGRSIAARFVEAGAQVVVCGRSAPADPGPGEFIACDVRQAEAVRAMTDAIGARYGRIDALINNAGGSPQADAATASPRFSEAIIGLNLMAPLHVAQACHRWMQERGGAIVNIASVSAVRPSPGTAAYAAAKGGLLALSRSLAQEWAPKIRVNAVIAGLIETETAEATYGSPAAQAEVAASVPLGRLGRGDDIANAALYLASPLAEFVTGAELLVHGGGDRPAFLGIVAKHGG
ncbi:MAG: SDR family oxidoreductase [Hyphomonadaceae bacterium]|nr:SDR family oxidoreductase [Hyphomonadaceae bacterium]